MPERNESRELRIDSTRSAISCTLLRASPAWLRACSRGCSSSFPSGSAESPAWRNAATACPAVALTPSLIASRRVGVLLVVAAELAIVGTVWMIASQANLIGVVLNQVDHKREGYYKYYYKYYSSYYGDEAEG